MSGCIQIPGGGGGGGQLPDTVDFFDDFFVDSASFGPVFHPDMPVLGWTIGGSFGGTFNSLDGVADHPGIEQLQCVTSGGAFIMDGEGSVGNPVPTTGLYRAAWGHRLRQLATALQPFEYRAGLANVWTTTPSAPTHPQILFFYDRNNANWICRTADGVGVTSVNSGVAVAANTWVRTEVVCSGAPWSSVEFRINGVAVATIATTIPSVAQANGVIIFDTEDTGDTDRDAELDYFHMRYQVARP